MPGGRRSEAGGGQAGGQGAKGLRWPLQAASWLSFPWSPGSQGPKGIDRKQPNTPPSPASAGCSWHRSGHWEGLRGGLAKGRRQAAGPDDCNGVGKPPATGLDPRGRTVGSQGKCQSKRAKETLPPPPRGTRQFAVQLRRQVPVSHSVSNEHVLRPYTWPVKRE